MTQSVAPLDLRRDLVALLPRLRRFALTLAPSMEAADGLVREACLKAISKGRPEGENERFLFRLVRDQSLETMRDKPEADAADLKIKAPAKGRPTVHQAIVLDMPQALASVFLLVEVEGLSHAETADILDISTGKVASYLCDARLHLADPDTHQAERRA